MNDAESVQHLRETVAQHVERGSLRSVARQIGLSSTGLRGFLDGSDPYGPTIRRLRKWYIQHACLADSEVSHADAAAALAVLTFDLPEGPRRAAANTVMEAIARGYDASGRGRPRWVADLRAEHGTPEAGR